MYFKEFPSSLISAAPWRPDAGAASSGDGTVWQRSEQIHSVRLRSRRRPTGKAGGRLENRPLQPDRHQR